MGLDDLRSDQAQYKVLLELDPQYQEQARLAREDRVQVAERRARAARIGGARCRRPSARRPSTTSGSCRPCRSRSASSPGVSLGAAVDHVNRTAAACCRRRSPPSFQGSAKTFQQSLQNLGLLLFIAIGVVYIVLGMLYESYIHPLTILSGLPSAGLGALVTL